MVTDYLLKLINLKYLAVSVLEFSFIITLLYVVITMIHYNHLFFVC